MNEQYHMIDYIHESPAALEKTLSDNSSGVKELVGQIRDRNINRIILSAVGSSYTAALIALPLFQYHCKIPAYVMSSTEIGAYGDRLLDRNTLLIAISRSGERGWVVDSLKKAVERGALGVAITGVSDSLMASHADIALVTSEGKEITFPKTKSVVTCCGLLMRLALEMAGKEDQAARDRLNLLNECPVLLKEMIEKTELQVTELVPELIKHNYLMAGGTLGNYGVALEFGIKLQETAGIPVTCNDSGNVLHGPWGGIDNQTMVSLMATAYDRELAAKIFDLAGRMGARRMVITEPGISLRGLTEYRIELPFTTDVMMSGLFHLVPVQLITYYWAVAKGLNPDAPEGVQDMLNAMLPPGRKEP
jgi:glucosamine--fructose-6-phosphate aminotransferase (isomerizing)